MINLFENYTKQEADLEYSLKQAGYTHPTVVLQDDGYLPEHVLSPIRFFCGIKGASIAEANPMFFNEVPIPNIWEIRGDGQKADVYDGYRQKAHINYSTRKEDYRAVKSVDWYNDFGRVRVVDLYDQNGLRFGRKTNSDGELSLSTYYDEAGREVILMNHQTGTIQVYFEGKDYLFTNFEDFVIFYLKVADLGTEEIFYNNLGRPFFVTRSLERQNPEKHYQHKLFWQETADDLPGNMKTIVTDENSATQQIIVQNREEYLRLKSLLDGKNKIPLDYLGYIYNLEPVSEMKPGLFVFTNSDEIEGLPEIARALSDFKIFIAARTTMSSKLMAFENSENANVFLYPTVDDHELQDIMAKTSFYLDVNHGNEVEDIVRTAFEANHLILALENTVHNRRFTGKDYIFPKEKVAELIASLKALRGNEADFVKALNKQAWAAGQATVQDYKEVLGE